MMLAAVFGGFVPCSRADNVRLDPEQDTLDVDDGEPGSEPGGGDLPIDPFDRDSARFLLFSTADLWRNGGFSHGGVLWAPRGLIKEGPVLKLIFGGGVYRYVSGALGNFDVIGEQLAGGVLPGWRFVRNAFTVTVFAGYDFQSHRLFPDDPSAGLRGVYSGLRAGFELWYQPSPRAMIAADGSISTVGWSYSGRIAAGWRVFDWFYFGPEFSGFANGDNYRQLRAGFHITGLQTWRWEWSGGLGYAADSDRRGGVYGKFGVITRR
jgi:Cellulose biosynthesis protein BcsS